MLNLSEEHDLKDVEVNITLKDENDKLKEFMRNSGVYLIKEQLNTYIRLLKEEFSRGLILPLKNGNDTRQTERAITPN